MSILGALGHIQSDNFATSVMERFWSKNADYENTDFPNSPEVVLRSDVVYFGSDNFSATLEWSQYNDRETYSFAIIPAPLHTGRNTTTSVQLVLLYNTQYNVTVTANLCGHSNATNFAIHYGK